MQIRLEDRATWVYFCSTSRHMPTTRALLTLNKTLSLSFGCQLHAILLNIYTTIENNGLKGTLPSKFIKSLGYVERLEKHKTHGKITCHAWLGTMKKLFELSPNHDEPLCFVPTTVSAVIRIGITNGVVNL